MLDYILKTVRRPDIALAMGVVAILTVLILPLPGFLLDMFLAISITVSVLILMTSLFTREPLDFSSFPTVLLIATMLRLSLNLASTRLILVNGHEGTDAAGQVIEAFGTFIMGGNFVIGIIIFGILVIVNFIVLTKGAGRIAEVAARFSLDAMPGKQMAIDSDLSSGVINENEAKTLRKKLEDESNFFGSMDGASKFVRGDAIAGLLITFINVIGGIIIGVAQNGMSVGDAAQSYTLLTVGDGLVSQIPALIVSTAAGLLVSKSTQIGTTDEALFSQLGGYPRALGMSGGLMGFLAIVPGTPFVPFMTLALVAGGLSYLSSRALDKKEIEEVSAAQEQEANAPVEEDPISHSLHIDHIRLELGYGLLPMINGQGGERLTDQIKGLRRQLAQELGFVLPSVRIQDNLQLPPNQYIVRIKEIGAGEGELRPTMLLIMDPRGENITIPGEDTMEPTFGLPAKWVDESQREESLFRGYTVVDASTVITTHLTEVVKDNISELLSYSETQKLLDELPEEHQKLTGDIIPGQISISGLQRVLQNLLSEHVSIRDLPTILEGVSEATSYTRNANFLTEHVRSRLARQISNSLVNEQGFIPMLSLSPQWEQVFTENLVGDGEEKQLSMAPSQLQDFINAVRQTFEQHAMTGETPVMLCSPGIRPYVRSVVERFRPATVVLSQSEVHPKVKIKTLGSVQATT